MSTTILILSALLAMAFLATRLAAWLRVPHSVFLVLLGILGGLCLRAAHLSVPSVLETEYPDIVLFLLLPPLVFESAYNMDSRQLFRDWIPTGALAVFGMLLNSVLIGLSLHWFLQVRLEAALLFGSLISATDPVAVVSLFKEVGAPHRLATLVEGESLVNDGTALVLYRVLLGAAAGAHVSPVSGLLQFLVVCLGGVAVGGLFIVLVSGMLRFTAQSGTAQVGLTVAVAFASFIVADQGVHVSGVLSTLTVGLYLGRRARLELNRSALHSMHDLWEFLALSANSLVFLAVGLTVNLGQLWSSAATVPIVLLVVYLARATAVVLTLGPLGKLGWGKKVSGAYQAVIIWAGLRGGLALALVLLLPADLPEKPLFLAFATAVVLTSLLLNALTTGPLLRKLGLDRLSPQEYGLYLRSLQQTFVGVFDNYREAANRGTLSLHLLQTLEDSAERAVQSDLALTEDGSYEAQKLLLFEQQHYDDQFELDVLSARAYHVLSESVAERLGLLAEEGSEPLSKFPFWLQVKPRIAWLAGSQLDQLALQLEVLLHLNLWLDAQVSELQKAWALVARARLDEFYQSVPHLGLAVQHRFLARSVFASAGSNMEELCEAGIVSRAVLARARQTLDRFLQEQHLTSVGLFRPRTLDLLKHTPLFATLPEAALVKLQTNCQQHTLAPHTVVIHEGAPGDSCYLVLQGMLSVSSQKERVECSRLFAGALFGELSLLEDRPRTATVTTEMECRLLEIDRQLFHELMAEFSDFRREIGRIAAERRAAIAALP